jgi:hypothetical protein
MGQNLSLGQLCDVQNKIKIDTKHWLGLFIYYDMVHIGHLSREIAMLSFGELSFFRSSAKMNNI